MSLNNCKYIVICTQVHPFICDFSRIIYRSGDLIIKAVQVRRLIFLNYRIKHCIFLVSKKYVCLQRQQSYCPFTFPLHSAPQCHRCFAFSTFVERYPSIGLGRHRSGLARSTPIEGKHRIPSDTRCVADSPRCNTALLQNR